MFVTGTLPKLSDDAEVTFPDHEDEFRREGPGESNMMHLFLLSISSYK